MSSPGHATKVGFKLTRAPKSFLPRLLYYVTIPALRHAPLAIPPTKAKRWPVMVFSHGLGGSRNAYSHITGSLASHGVVVVAPEHRDGSGPIAFIREADGRQTRAVDYVAIPHSNSGEVLDARDKQLKIRLWEMGLVHDALLKMDRGEELHNFAADSSPKPGNSEGDLAMFASNLDVHTPGSIAWSGHSFGAATIIQFIKSVFYTRAPPSRDYKPLYIPSANSSIVRQITPSTHITLLDLWVMPLRSRTTRWLWDQPLPCYSPGGPGGSNLLAILSEAFFKWESNLNYLKRAVSESPSRERSSSRSASRMAPPHIFYPVSSAHLSQSDFGVLFPWLTKKAFKAVEPERTLRLNVRAILEVMRVNGTEVGDTSSVDMEEEVKSKHTLANGHANGHVHGSVGNLATSLGQDHKILAADGSVRGWVALSVDGETHAGEASNKSTQAAADPKEAVMSGEAMS